MLEPGTPLGKYVLGRKLGQGGFGVVFRAHDASLDREVALKFLHAEHTSTPQVLQRFLQEARSAAKIAHPGIVTVYECGQMAEAGGAAYIAMELLVGESLTDRLARSGRLSPAAAMEVARQVAAALEAAHRVGIVHRDLKPDNIFLVHDPAVRGGERIKVLDFGIAKLGRAATSSIQTQSMMVFGTPRYMSPEQCKSAANVDHRSDIYTLGCILFELVTGQPPFAGEPGELIAQHLLVPPPVASSIVTDLPVGLDKLIAALLAKNPDARPLSMAAVQLSLESGGDDAPGVAPTLAHDAPSLPPRPSSAALGVPPPVFMGSLDPTMAPGAPKPASPTTLGVATGSSVVNAPAVRRGHGWIYAVAAVVILGGVAGGAAMFHGGGDSTPAPIAAAAPTPAPTPKPAEPAASAPAPAPAPAPVVEPPPAKTIEAPKPAAKTIPQAHATTGTLALDARPACDILVDGAPAGQTPQRLALAPGRHRIQLVDAADQKIKDSFTVDTKAGVTQSIAKDFTPKQAPVVTPPPPPVVEPPKKDGTINPFAHKGT